ncbi:MAG: threonine synthase, partial [Chloroflexi bacterium]|nr:threonine synthase [Chloroflexota bacterium]MCH8974857.1 threonine synthase [Chloroflexota bacterium]
MKSYLSHLECTVTGETYDADEVHTLSPGAQAVLYPRYDLPAAARELDRTAIAARPPGIWRFFELMPVRDEANVVTMGEGGTPMLRARRLERAHDAR